MNGDEEYRTSRFSNGVFVSESGSGSESNSANQANKSHISSLLTSLNAQLDLIKANFAAKKRFNVTTSPSTTMATTDVPNNTMIYELDEDRRRDNGFITSNDPIKIVDFIANSLLQQTNNGTIGNSSNTLEVTRSSLCSCNNSIHHQQDKFLNSSNNEINNIWKLAFFILAFFVGFVSLLLIMVFSLKIIVTKLNKRRILKYDIGHYYLPSHQESMISSSHNSSKSQSNTTAQLHKSTATTSISMLDFDLNSSNSQSNSGNIGMMLKNNNNGNLAMLPANLMTMSKSKKRRTSSGNSSSTSSSSPSGNNKHKSSTGNHKNNKNSINSRLTTVTNLNSNLTNHLFSKESNYITEEELLDCQKQQEEAKKERLSSKHQGSQQCYIYGIANRGFLDDSQLSGFYNANSNSSSVLGGVLGGANIINSSLIELKPSNLLFDSGGEIGSPLQQMTSIVPSSFRPTPKAKSSTPPQPPTIPSLQSSPPSNELSQSTNTNLVVVPLAPPPPPSTSPSDAAAAANNEAAKKTNKATICSITDDEIGEIDIKKLMIEQYQSPNDYEALENNTVTGSLANLSSVTTFSEIYSESKVAAAAAAAAVTMSVSNTVSGARNEEDTVVTPTLTTTLSTENKSSSSPTSSASSSSSYICSSSSPPPSVLPKLATTTTTASSREFILTCSNTNELISRSSKITQELEARLRERRQLMESKSDKFQPKLLHENEFTSISQAISLSHLEKRLQNWSNNNSSTEKTPNIQPSMIKAAVVSAAVPSSSGGTCICPCHAHSGTSSNKDEKCTATTHHRSTSKSDQRKYEKSANTMIHNHNHSYTHAHSSNHLSSTSTMVNNHKNSRKAKIIIDGSSTLPSKRESIRMLIENKAVSENKQKGALEMHLNTLLCSRKPATTTATTNQRINT